MPSLLADPLGSRGGEFQACSLGCLTGKDAIATAEVLLHFVLADFQSSLVHDADILNGFKCKRPDGIAGVATRVPHPVFAVMHPLLGRHSTEERRVGKESVST